MLSSPKVMPMVPNRRASLPIVYGDTPSFLGVDVVDPRSMRQGYDIIIAGVPWEGTITWGSYSGCEHAPRSVRHATARYGGFLPEYGIDVFDYLKIGDIGDTSVNTSDPAETMRNVHETMRAIYENNSIPIVLGGDHSFTQEIIKALSVQNDGDIGVIHFDAHFDNSPSFGNDEFPRCGPIHRIAQIDKVRTESIVHIGIRGPRNSPAQYEYAKKMGATTFTIRDIRKEGIDNIIEKAITIARTNTKHVFVSICSDCVDAAFNPGGPADFNGLFPHELFSALYRLGEEGIAGLDYVEIYPKQDPMSFSSHLASFGLIHMLAGMASRKKNQTD